MCSRVPGQLTKADPYAVSELDLYSPACRAIVDELNYSISQVDPKKTINIGSFRLNPDGTMKDKKVQYNPVPKMIFLEELQIILII